MATYDGYLDETVPSIGSSQFSREGIAFVVGTLEIYFYNRVWINSQSRYVSWITEGSADSTGTLFPYPAWWGGASDYVSFQMNLS